MKKAVICLVMIAGVSLAVRLGAQEIRRIVRILNNPPAPESPAKEAAEEETSVEEQTTPLFYLRDRSKVAGLPQIEFLLVQTRYGALRIPRNELVRVRFVPRVDAGVQQKVSALLAQLGSDDFDAREVAMDGIRKIGLPALPLIREAVNSSNEEVKTRAGLLVEELEELKEKQGGAGDALPSLEGTDDEIVTTRMTIKGRVEADRFTVGSRYGNLVIDVADIQTISFQSVGPTSQKWDVDPKFQPPGNWYDTKFDVEKGQKISLEASGIVTVNNYSVSCGPTGTRQWGGTSWNNFAQLSLVGKIGKKGKPFAVGANYRGKSAAKGRLYLAIVAFSYNPTGAVGKYTVKARTGGSD